MKPTTPRSSAYLQWIRNQPCAGICSHPQYLRNGRNYTSVVAAHVRILGSGGIALKPSDFRTVPLCNNCHQYQHKIGEVSFWEVHVQKVVIGVVADHMARFAAEFGFGSQAITALEDVLGQI